MKRSLFLRAAELLGVEWAAEHRIVYFEDFALTTLEFLCLHAYKGIRYPGYTYVQTTAGTTRIKTAESGTKQLNDIIEIAKRIFDVTKGEI